MKPVQYRSNWFRSGPDRVPGPIVTFPVLQFASNLLSSSGENPAIRPGTTIRAILEGTKFCQNFQNFAETASSAPFLPSVSSFLIFGPGTRSTNFGPVRTGPNPLDRSGPVHLYRSSSLTAVRGVLFQFLVVFMVFLWYTKGKLSVFSNKRNFVGVPGGDAFHRFKQPKFRWGTRRGSFPSFQTNEISLGYPAGKLSIVSNNRNFGGVHEEEAFHRFKQTKFRWGTRRGSFPSLSEPIRLDADHTKKFQAPKIPKMIKSPIFKNLGPRYHFLTARKIISDQKYNRNTQRLKNMIFS